MQRLEGICQATIKGAASFGGNKKCSSVVVLSLNYLCNAPNFVCEGLWQPNEWVNDARFGIQLSDLDFPVYRIDPSTRLTRRAPAAL